jgi:hypothetical protein
VKHDRQNFKTRSDFVQTSSAFHAHRRRQAESPDRVDVERQRQREFAEREMRREEKQERV